MKKVLFLALTAIIPSVMILGSFTDVVRAVSVYDNAYKVTDNLTIRYKACDTKTFINLEEFGEFLGVRDNWDSQSFYDNNFAEINSILSTNNASVFSVDDNKAVGNENRQFLFHLAKNNSFYNLEWSTNSVVLKAPDGLSDDHFSLQIAMNSSCVAKIYTFSGPLNMVLSDYFGADHSILNVFTTGNVNYNYPPNYEGNLIKDEFIPRQFNQTQFDWTVKQSGAFDVRYAQNIRFELSGYMTLETFKCDDKFQNCNTIITPKMRSHPAQNARWYGAYPIPYQGEFKLPEEGNYLFQVLMICSISEPGCETGSPSDLTVGAAWQVKWDGRTFITGSTDPAAVFTTWDYSVNPFWQMLDSASTPTFGLQAAVLAPLTFLQDLVGQLGNCQPIVMPKLVIFEFEFECVSPVIKSNFPQVVLIYQTIISALIFYYIFVRFFSLVKDAQDPGKNKIEVMKL